MKTQTKTFLLLLFPFLGVILLFSGFVFFSVTTYSNKDFFKLLEVRALNFARSELDARFDEQLSEITSQYDESSEKLMYEKDYYFQVNNSLNIADVANQVNVSENFIQSILLDGSAELIKNSIFYKGIFYSSKNGDYIVIASAENYFEAHHKVYLRQIIFVAILLAFVVTFLLSYYFTNLFFKPVRNISERVRLISSENLHLRLDVANKNDELKKLARTFNDMLDRLETSFETQNNFISNASHELRTPLTAIIGEADVALSKIRKPEEYIEALSVILEEADKLDRKTKALLFLAQTGFSGTKQKFQKVRIDQLLLDVKETIEKITPSSKIHIDLSLLPENPMKLKTWGNEQLLHLALSNIISNACKYSNNKPVKVSIGASDSSIFIVVKDTGIGIPDKELKHIYDPFFRASNTSSFEGYGIGLPLSRNIIRMHKGELIVTSIENEGTTVNVKLPIADAQSAHETNDSE